MSYTKHISLLSFLIMHIPFLYTVYTSFILALSLFKFFKSILTVIPNVLHFLTFCCRYLPRCRSVWTDWATFESSFLLARPSQDVYLLPLISRIEVIYFLLHYSMICVMASPMEHFSRMRCLTILASLVSFPVHEVKNLLHFFTWFTKRPVQLFISCYLLKFSIPFLV